MKKTAVCIVLAGIAALAGMITRGNRSQTDFQKMLGARINVHTQEFLLAGECKGDPPNTKQSKG